MKKGFLYSVFIFSVLIMSCTSNKIENTDAEINDNYDYSEVKVIEAPEKSSDFIGDFGPIQMENLMVLQKSKGSVKPKEIKSVYLIPRTNSIELQFRDGLNIICIILDKTERDKIAAACNIFLTQYEERTLPHHKINSKTAYMNSKCSLWFGVSGPTMGSEKNDYYVNCEFIDKTPYLLIHFSPSRTTTNEFTPKVSIYMSPTQIRTFLEQIKQENLEALVKTLEEKAYTY